VNTVEQIRRDTIVKRLEQTGRGTFEKRVKHNRCGTFVKGWNRSDVAHS
jgi:hypothetical protein